MAHCIYIATFHIGIFTLHSPIINSILKDFLLCSLNHNQTSLLLTFSQPTMIIAVKLNFICHCTLFQICLFFFSFASCSRFGFVLSMTLSSALGSHLDGGKDTVVVLKESLE